MESKPLINQNQDYKNFFAITNCTNKLSLSFYAWYEGMNELGTD